MKRKLATILALCAAFAVLALLLWLGSVEVPAPDDAAEGVDVAAVQSSSVAGFVTDIEDRPVEGATVSVADRTATTDSRGRFVVRDVPPGEIVVTASLAGAIDEGPLAARVEARVESGSSLDDVRLVLRRFGLIAGRITANGAPVTARLSVLYAGEEFAIDGIGTSSPQDGAFDLAEVPPGRLRILVEADDFALTESREIDLDDGERVVDIDIDLAAAGTLAGKVIDTAGNPVQAAEVYAIGPSAPRPKLARTTATGGFRFDNFPVGAARVRVVAGGYIEEVVEDVVVERGAVTAIEVIVERPRGVFGTVVDRDGPVAGAWIVQPGRRGDPLRSGTDGGFAIDGTPEGSIVAVTPRHEASEPVSGTSVSPIELRLGPGGMIRGHVVGPDGEPVQEFEIGVEAFEVDGPAPYGAREIGLESFIASDGSFAFGPLRPGRYWLRASARGHAPGSSDVVHVTSGGTASDVEIALTAGGIVRGVVTSGSGGPVARAVVQLFDPLSPFRSTTARTNDDGAFELRGVPPGRRSLRVSARGYLASVSSGIEVPAAGEATRNVVLRPRARGEKFQFHGIGAVLRRDGDAIVIQETTEGHPAATFGLQPGDRILSVDGEATKDMRLDNVVELIRGEEGAGVQLEVQRDGGRFDVQVERGRVIVR